ncbi:hypothetical protein L596_030023 [Steinernema carpocapsae]|uniref:ADP/ATP translocase n=1 Tax=Steinernema carpocapsae TaxID=34508 RepID=A0A4U5LRH5_STECR|nr:hypothetical protein L596_030023 [Steinernema carpocapsae]
MSTVNRQTIYNKTSFSFFAVEASISAITLTALAPLSRAQILLQVQDASRSIHPNNRYKGIIDVLVRVPKEQGFRALWRGNLSGVLGFLPWIACSEFIDNYRKHSAFERLSGIFRYGCLLSLPLS